MRMSLGAGISQRTRQTTTVYIYLHAAYIATNYKSGKRHPHQAMEIQEEDGVVGHEACIMRMRIRNLEPDYQLAKCGP